MSTYFKIAYWVFTALFCFIMLYSATMYFTKYEMVEGFFKNLGYPTYLIYPLATLKIVGVITILTNFNKTLKEWAYSAFFFEVVLAFFAHYMMKDGAQGTALVALVLLALSYFFWKKTYLKSNKE